MMPSSMAELRIVESRTPTIIKATPSAASAYDMVGPVTLTSVRIYDRLIVLTYDPFTLIGAIIMRTIAGWVSGHPLGIFSTVDQGKWMWSLVPTSARSTIKYGHAAGLRLG